MHRTFSTRACSPYGYLGLGRSETIRFTPHEAAIEEVCGKERTLPEDRMIVIGASLGGMKALQMDLLGLCPSSFPRPIALVLHRQKDSDDRLIRDHSLGLISPWPVRGGGG